MRRVTVRPYGANFVLDFPIEERLAVALEYGVRVISFFWADAGSYVARVKSSGAVAIQVVSSIGEAKRAADAGFDLIVAQGREAGGHVRGCLGTMALVPQVVDAVAPLPVLAAGGIADRRGVAAAIALGAAGVWVGTRFLAATEANIHEHYQTEVLASSGDDTLYSELFDIGWPAAPLRTLKNSTTRRWEEAGRPLRQIARAKARPWHDVPMAQQFHVIFLGLPRAMWLTVPRRWPCMPVKPSVWCARRAAAADIVSDLAAGLPQRSQT